MFQTEFRETVMMCINVICAVLVLASISYGLQLKNKVGAATTETYAAQNTVEMHYEFNKYDGNTLTADECIAAFAEYINSDVKLCIVDEKDSGSPYYINKGVIYSIRDYREHITDYSVENIRLGKNNKIGNGTLYFEQSKTYDVYLGYDDEDPLHAQDKYSRDTNGDGVYEPPVKESQTRPNRVSSLTFVVKH